MSLVSRVQEILQKQKLPPPDYTYERLGGPQHCPRMTCMGSMNFYEWEELGRTIGTVQRSICFHSKACKSKKDARNDVARQMFNFLCPDEAVEPEVYMYQPPADFQTIVCIDLENQAPPSPLPLSFSFVHGPYYFIGYCASHHPRAMDPVIPQKMELRTIESTRPDGADIFMTMDVALLRKQYPKAGFLLISGDHFVDTLVEVLQAQGTEATSVAHFVSQ